MALATGQQTVSVVAAVGGASNVDTTCPFSLTVEWVSGSAFYVGITGVTSATGLLVPAVSGASVTVDLDPGEVLYAVSASSTVVAWCRTRSQVRGG